MIYGSSQGQSALGSLLRKMQEETLSNPARVPQAAGESSPIRAQIQGPIDSPESVGSEKVVAMKPELAPSTETPSPVAANNMVSPTPMGLSAAAAGSPTVVGPNNIQVPSSPSISAGITPGSSPSSPVKSSVSALPISSKTSSPSLGSSALLPSSVKPNNNFNSNLKNVINNSGSIRAPDSKSISPSTAAKGLGSSQLMQSLGSLSSRLMLAPAALATIMSKTTLAKALQSMQYGGKKGTKI